MVLYIQNLLHIKLVYFIFLFIFSLYHLNFLPGRVDFRLAVAESLALPPFFMLFSFAFFSQIGICRVAAVSLNFLPQ